MANIMSNAIKYSHKGVIKLIAKTFENYNGERRFMIKVKDQGIGIKDVSQIGQMFKQLEIKDNVNQNGIGFGLTISKMIIEKLGGTLMIKSNRKKSYFPSSRGNS